MQILSLASALRSLDLVNDEIDNLECTTISAVTRYGNETRIAHPVFKTQKNTLDSITKQMKALSLTAEDLIGMDDEDPLTELTKKLTKKRKSPTIIKPED